MTEPTPQANGGEKPAEDARALAVKAEHRQAMAQMEMQHLDVLLADQPLAVRVYFDPVLFKMWEERAELISRSQSVPEHLRGDIGACMNVLDRSLAWRMSPWMVAQGQYTARRGATPGYFGRVIIAALNGSGRLEGGLQFEFFEDEGGSWDKVTGKFAMRPGKRKDENDNPIMYAQATYTDADEKGLGVIVRGHIKGEERPRELKVYMRQCQPRNSVIWATDPRTQLIYTAGRRFGNAYMPELLMGVRTDDDLYDNDERREMKDITPPAPEPVDLKEEQIRGGGAPQAQDAPERQERSAAEAAADVVAAAGTPNRGRDPQTVSTSPPDEDAGWSLEVAGRQYRKPGWAAKALAELAQKAQTKAEFLHRYQTELAALPKENLAAVMAALADKPEGELQNDEVRTTVDPEVGTIAADAGQNSSLFEATVGGTTYRSAKEAAGALVRHLEESDNPDGLMREYDAVIAVLDEPEYDRVEQAHIARVQALNSQNEEVRVNPRAEQSSLGLGGDDDQDTGAATRW